MGVLKWIKLFRNRRIVLFCYNESVIHMVNRSTSNCRQCMVLMRLLVAESICCNVRIFAKHVRTKLNGKADALSRLDLKRFWRLAEDSMNVSPSELPEEVWPMRKLWLK